MIKIVVTGLLASVLMTAPAEAQYYYGSAERNFHAFLSFSGIIFFVIFLYYLGRLLLGSIVPREPTRPVTPEDYDQMAAQLRAKARMLDAQAAHDDSHAKAVLKQQELREVQEFLKDQRQKRSQDRRVT